MNLTTVHEIEARLGRPLTTEEAGRVDVMIRDVSAGLYAVAPRIPRKLPIPDTIIALASYKTIAGLSAGASATGGAVGDIASEGLGGYQVSYRTSTAEVSTGAMSLSKAEFAVLKPWMHSRIGTVQIDATTAVAV